MPSSEPALDRSDKILILTPDANSHRRDFDGVFKPESLVLERCYQPASVCRVVRVPVAPVDPRTLRVLSGQRAFVQAARAVVAAISDGTPWTHVIMLCHGWATGLQLGFRCNSRRPGDPESFAALVEALARLPLQTLTLFACSAGADPQSRTSSPGTGDNSIADALRDAVGCTVIAHVTVGHATRNPNLIAFEPSHVPLIGGIRVAQPGSALFKNARRLLSNQKKPGARRATGDVPPRQHKRPAFASIPLCRTVIELQALLSATAA